MTTNAPDLFEMPKRTLHSSLMDLAELVVEATRIEADEDHAEEEPTLGSLAQSKQSENNKFEVRADGVFHHGLDHDGEAKPELRLCGRLDILAKTRDEKSAEWGRFLKWKDDDGVPHLWAMPSELLQSDGVAVRSELARLGLAIAPGRAAHDLLLTYLQEWPVTGRARCVDRMGWHGSVYVVPSGTIGEGKELVVFQNIHATEPALSSAGTVAEWRDKVAAPARGNSRIVFALSASFAGPLLEPAGEDSGGFHLRGASSSGKTTALRVGASVWGSPSRYCRLWRATTNGLEGLASLHNDGVLILDELGQVDPRDAGEAAYMLANGRGKARAARDGTARQSASWRTLLLSAGEVSLTSLMAQVRRKPTAGQEIRLADFDAEAGMGTGVVECLNGYENPAALIGTLRDGASRFYGSVGEEWLRLLVKDRSNLANFISSGIEQFVKEYAPAASTGQVKRVARRFALVAVAGELATRASLTGWQEHEAEQATGKCFKAWLESFGGGTTNRETHALLANVKEFFELHGKSRFEEDTEQRVINNRAGFVRGTEEKREFLVLPEVFHTEVCKGFDSRSAIKTLKEQGWLIPGNDNKNTQKPRVPGIGTTRVYVISAKMWEHDDET
jgi:putative DNA primase/helicase